MVWLAVWYFPSFNGVFVALAREGRDRFRGRIWLNMKESGCSEQKFSSKEAGFMDYGPYIPLWNNF